MNNNSPILESTNISKIFADGKLYVEVLKDINLTIQSKEMVAIVGASGEGKSTLLHLLGGLDKPTTGFVNVCGQNITALKPAAQGALRNKYLGFIYQFHHLLPEFDALENVCMPLLIRKQSPKFAKQKARELLNKVGLSQRLNHRVGELSGGERQRVAIARALITDPLCVLADEPTGNLDHKAAAQILELMLKLNQELNTAFLIVTHDLNLAGRLDRQLILENGVL
ncbi:MAG: lipoprotein-releasing ABC transporter ATP-binding protein LolD [Gammaproteobacteria bacterium]|nr:lipoprotein-releasing ABC transporter ATP-binding protein LolD [Gammaproteobacteria bacterium]